jgi:hypothetical protein
MYANVLVDIVFFQGKQIRIINNFMNKLSACVNWYCYFQGKQIRIIGPSGVRAPAQRSGH